MSGITQPSFAPRLLLASAGLLIWGAHFLFIYIFAALACARSFADWRVAGIGIVPLAILVSTAMMLLLLAWLSIHAWRTEDRVRVADPATSRFLQYLGAALAVYSVAAILLQVVPTLIIPVCT